MNRSLRPLFKLVAIAEDEAMGQFFAVVRFRDVDGDVRIVYLQRDVLGDSNALKKLLSNAGAHFSEDPSRNRAALRALTVPAEKPARWNFAPGLGWYGPRHRIFVFPRRVIGRPQEGAILRPPRTLGTHVKLPGRRGTLGEWRAKIARPAELSSAMVTGICAAFAAPLLKMTGMHSFAIYLAGPSKSGKSTVTLVAGSVIGFGSENDLPNFRSTDAALGEIPMAFNDSLLPINELGLLKGNARERRERMRDFSYGLAEGRGTTYSRFVPTDKLPPIPAFRTIVLANGEETSDDLARKVGAVRMAGESVRWIDLPAVHEECPDVFDRAPASVTHAERQAWFEKMCRNLRRHCKDQRGVAIRHFIKHAVADPPTIQKDIDRLRRRFVRRVTETDDEQIVRHLAKCFGHIYAAGILAIRFGTVPWSESLVSRCIRRCYWDARRELKTEVDMLGDALRTLNAHLANADRVVLADHGNSPRALRRADGYRRKLMGRTLAIISAQAFKSWFKDPRHAELVLRFLAKHNALANKPTPTTRGRSVVWAESQPKWPDGPRRRSIVIDIKPYLLKRLEN